MSMLSLTDHNPFSNSARQLINNPYRIRKRIEYIPTVFCLLKRASSIAYNTITYNPCVLHHLATDPSQTLQNPCGDQIIIKTNHWNNIWELDSCLLLIESSQYLGFHPLLQCQFQISSSKTKSMTKFHSFLSYDKWKSTHAQYWETWHRLVYNS